MKANELQINNFLQAPNVQFVIPVYQKILNNQRQNQHLTDWRDWLLPVLMNGQVSVN
jgi:hypothetical protein